MDAYLYDALRAPRGKAKASGALASLKPVELLAQLPRLRKLYIAGSTELSEAALPQPKIAIARHQAVAENQFERPVNNSIFAVIAVIVLQHMLDVIRIAHQIDRPF